jgi:hypothetical protein
MISLMLAPVASGLKKNKNWSDVSQNTHGKYLMFVGLGLHVFFNPDGVSGRIRGGHLLESRQDLFDGHLGGEMGQDEHLRLDKRSKQKKKNSIRNFGQGEYEGYFI